MSDHDGGPVFIAGAERSGKTLMRFMLSLHPNLAMTKRTNMWTHFYRRYGDLGREGNFERCLAAMLAYKHVRFLGPDAERIRREFWQGAPSYARLFALFQEHHAEREGKPRWGDQTGLVERYAGPIFAAYPTAKMIHMIRDPRDRYEARLARAARRPGSPRWGQAGIAAASWLHSARLALRNQQKYPGRYKIVGFESMVSLPEATLREVCCFLDETYEPAMLSMEGIPRYRSSALHLAADALEASPEIRPGESPLSAEYIGRYRQRVSKSEIAFIQMVSRRDMLAHGYPLEPIRMTLMERVRFFTAECPVNILSLFSRSALERMPPIYA